MDNLVNFFRETDLRAYVVAVLIALVCAVPFVQAFTDVWRPRPKREK